MIKGNYEWDKSIDLQILALKDAWGEYCKREYLTGMFIEGGTGMRNFANEEKRAWFADELERLMRMKIEEHKQ